LDVWERMFSHVMKTTLGVDIPTPLPRLTYAESMARYGCDKPDTRYGMELVELRDIVADSGFKVFTNALATGGQVKAICAPGASALAAWRPLPRPKVKSRAMSPSSSQKNR